MVDKVINNRQKDWKAKDDVICYLPIASTKKEVRSQKVPISRTPKEECFDGIK